MATQSPALVARRVRPGGFKWAGLAYRLWPGLAAVVDVVACTHSGLFFFAWARLASCITISQRQRSPVEMVDDWKGAVAADRSAATASAFTLTTMGGQNSRNPKPEPEKPETEPEQPETEKSEP
jgi:hypothetical protein